MSQLLAQGRGSILEAMLSTDAIVRYVETGEIASLSPGDKDLVPGRSRNRAQASA